ncbi:MAG: polysaccharide biosynthesis protein [Clostridia bacterium]|nr:polysaccharide biosynthesis protein [Clostridia bacterium]
MSEKSTSCDNFTERKRKTNKLGNRYISTLFLMLYDLLAAPVSYFAALWIRFDCRYTAIPGNYFVAWLKFAPIYAAICLVVYMWRHLYQSLWKFASFVELKRILISSVILGVLHAALITLLFVRMPISYYLMGITIQTAMSLFARFGYRFVSLERGKRAKTQSLLAASRVMLIGAGAAGQLILRDIHSAREINEVVACIIDDNPSKWGRSIDGVPIVGGRDDILLNVQKYNIQKIYLAIPSATAEQKRDILDICKETTCELKSLPGVFELVKGDVSAKRMREVKVEDLLGREPVRVNMDEIASFIKGKVVLVTGGGGSIGSELCRQIAGYGPKKLIIFDIYENNAHSISLELKDKYPFLDLEALIGSVRDSRRINQVFEKYKPDVVYHAAAHKHVPLMEGSPCEAIKNNAIGTYKTAYAAMKNGCKRFVLISTDKAVNPTNIMGASKRLCEMIIQSFDKKIREGKADQLLPICAHEGCADALPEGFVPHTEFVAVRFGNVLGSNGSVVPRFKEQIEKGGPVTVTHPDIIRYFMTIPEAASLVLQAGTYADGGEIFVLDMGSPVKIEALARNLIRLSGLRPDVDIKIAYTGLRPGEKLYEEKLMSEEGLKTTPNKLIHIGCPIPFNTDEFLHQLKILMDCANAGDEERIRQLVKKTVITYQPKAA